MSHVSVCACAHTPECTHCASPGVCAMSYSDRWVTRGDCFRSRASGCPIPPEAPRSATLPSLCNDTREYSIIKQQQLLGIAMCRQPTVVQQTNCNLMWGKSLSCGHYTSCRYCLGMALHVILIPLLIKCVP